MKHAERFGPVNADFLFTFDILVNFHCEYKVVISMTNRLGVGS